MRSLISQSSDAFRACLLGKQADVLWESVDGQENGEWVNSGLTSNFIRVHAKSTENLWNQFSRVKLISILDGVVYGEIAKE
jgi:hypothetical protein